MKSCAGAFCGGGPDVTGHVRASRGAGGDWTVTAPVCPACAGRWEDEAGRRSYGREVFPRDYCPTGGALFHPYYAGYYGGHAYAGSGRTYVRGGSYTAPQGFGVHPTARPGVVRGGFGPIGSGFHAGS